MIQKIKWPLIFIVTLLMSTFIHNTSIKTLILLSFWMFAFYPIGFQEFLYFIVSSIIFTCANFGALKNLTFEFTQKNLWLMPYNELFMWGFYCLNAHRFIGVDPNQKIEKMKTVIYTILFSVSFSLVHEKNFLAGILFVLFVVALFIFKSPRAYCYIGYFLFMGTIVESLGLSFQLWHYPHTNYFEIPIWAPFMWGNIGLILSLVTTWFFKN